MSIGLGTSGHRVIEHFHGVPFQQSLTRLREYVEIIRMILAGEPLKYHGKLFRLERGFRLRFPPVRSRIPIFIASLTPKSVRQTAQIADGWMPVMIPLEHLTQEVAAFRQLVRDAGRDAQRLIVRSPGAVTVTRNIDQAREESKAHLAFYITNMGDFYREQLIRLGYEEAVSTIRKAWDEGGRVAGTAAVPDALVESLFLAGSVEACVDRLQAQSAAGIDMHTVRVEADDARETVKILKRLVG
jgi:alkanesulfonate monooxygenase SsuD/methylene tetrahydromethanopterin reductase-like flavin-dependent oxidoreductase (luciferase family)